jgi:hypothetical protein
MCVARVADKCLDVEKLGKNSCMFESRIGGLC